MDQTRPDWTGRDRTGSDRTDLVTRVSNGCAEVYKPSSLLCPHIADASALPMLELGIMSVVTTMRSGALVTE